MEQDIVFYNKVINYFNIMEENIIKIINEKEEEKEKFLNFFKGFFVGNRGPYINRLYMIKK